MHLREWGSEVVPTDVEGQDILERLSVFLVIVRIDEWVERRIEVAEPHEEIHPHIGYRADRTKR